MDNYFTPVSSSESDFQISLHFNKNKLPRSSSDRSEDDIRRRTDRRYTTSPLFVHINITD